MNNPWVTIDLTEHPNLNKNFSGVWKAELTMINTNTGTIRVRVFDEDGTVLFKNTDVDASFIVEDSFEVVVR